jgi:hypothetical protein
MRKVIQIFILHGTISIPRSIGYILKHQNKPKRHTIEIVYFCIDEPIPQYKGVRGKGSAKIHEDINFNVPIAEKIMVQSYETEFF